MQPQLQQLQFVLVLSQQKNSIKEYVDLITKYSYKQQELNNQLNNNYEKQKSNKEDISVHNELREYLSQCDH